MMKFSMILAAGMFCIYNCGYHIEEAEPLPGIQVYSENPWYWEYHGKPLVLLGGSFEDNMYQFPNWYYGHNDPTLSSGMTGMTLEEHLDKMVEVGANYIRGSMSSRNYGNRFPYRKIEGVPGDNRDTDLYDLDQWDEEWENRLETFLRMSHERGIIISLELFDRFDIFLAEADDGTPTYSGNRNTGWLHHPWNPDRNINYTVESSGLPGGNITDMGYDHELYYCVPELAGREKSPEPVVLETLQRYVDKVLSYTFRYDNIIYVIENETYQRLEFGNYWAEYITLKAEERGLEIYVTNMAGQHDPEHERQKFIRRNSGFRFYDFSQNNHNSGREHYENIIAVRRDMSDNPSGNGIKPVNNVKIYGGEGFADGIEEGKRRFFRGIFGGLAAVRFHRPGYERLHYGIGLNEDAQVWIRSMRMFLDEFDIFRSEIASNLLDLVNGDEAYCLAVPGEQYAVYFPDRATVTLNMTGTDGRYDVRWLEIGQSRWIAPTSIAGGQVRTMSPPGSGQWVVLITSR